MQSFTDGKCLQFQAAVAKFVKIRHRENFSVYGSSHVPQLISSSLFRYCTASVPNNNRAAVRL